MSYSHPLHNDHFHRTASTSLKTDELQVGLQRPMRILLSSRFNATVCQRRPLIGQRDRASGAFLLPSGPRFIGRNSLWRAHSTACIRVVGSCSESVSSVWTFSSVLSSGVCYARSASYRVIWRSSVPEEEEQKRKSEVTVSLRNLCGGWGLELIRSVYFSYNLSFLTSVFGCSSSGPELLQKTLLCSLRIQVAVDSSEF